MNDINITVKANTRELQRQLNKLDLKNMGPTELEKYLKENITVTLLGSQTERRFYINIKKKKENKKNGILL